MHNELFDFSSVSDPTQAEDLKIDLLYEAQLFPNYIGNSYSKSNDEINHHPLIKMRIKQGEYRSKEIHPP